MDEQLPLLYLLSFAGGCVAVPFMIIQSYLAIRKGEMERRPPLRPISKEHDPAWFWGIIIFIMLGACGATWGMIVIAARLLNR